MVQRCILAALFVLLAIPVRADECLPVQAIVGVAMAQEPATRIAGQFSGQRARALAGAVRGLVVGEGDAVADQVLVLSRPDLPAVMLIGARGECASFHFVVLRPAYEALLKAAFGEPT